MHSSTSYCVTKITVPLHSGTYKTRGVEGEFLYRPAQQHFYKILFNIGDDTDKHFWKENPKAYGSTDTRMPTSSWGALGSWTFNNWQFSSAIYRIGKMEWGSSGTKVDAYLRTDASLSYQTSFIGDTDIKLKLIAQSFNNSHEEFDKNITIEPRYFFELGISGF